MGKVKIMRVTNPIIRGFYPDPSVCKANGKYYMVCSSFEYFPGVPLFESEDLINWKQIGHCLTRKTQVDLHEIDSSGGVFAPTIRYNNGRFYMVTTNDTYHKNFYVYTDNIYGEWSEPVFVEQDGIDPSLFFEDGKTYFMSNGSDPADNNGCIFQCEIDVATGKKLTESKPVWKGSGGRYLESPHLYHFGEWYYIMAAEGVDGIVCKEMELDIDANPFNCDGKYNVSLDKMDALSLRWCHLREYKEENYKFADGCLSLRGVKAGLSDISAPTFAGIRQSEFNTILNVNVKSDAEEVGITFYLCEKHHYDLAVCNNSGKKSVILRLCIGDATQIVKEKEFAQGSEEASFRVVSTNEDYSFYAKCGGEEVFMGKAGTKYLSSEVAGGFTGTVMAMYAVNKNDNEDKWAVFSRLDWEQGI